MLCKDAFTRYCVIGPVRSNSETELALGLIECMHKLRKPPKVFLQMVIFCIIDSALVKTNLSDNHITYVATKSRTMFAERMMLTFKTMLDKKIKPGNNGQT